LRPRLLPTAACSAASGTAAAESSKPTTAAKPAPAAESSATPASAATIPATSAKHSRKEHPEKYAPERGKKNDEYDDNQQDNTAG